MQKKRKKKLGASVLGARYGQKREPNVRYAFVVGTFSSRAVPPDAYPTTPLCKTRTATEMKLAAISTVSMACMAGFARSFVLPASSLSSRVAQPVSRTSLSSSTSGRSYASSPRMSIAIVTVRITKHARYESIRSVVALVARSKPYFETCEDE